MEDQPMDQGEEEEVQVLEEEQQEEQTEGAGDLVGGGVTEERLVGTMAMVDLVSPAPSQRYRGLWNMPTV